MVPGVSAEPFTLLYDRVAVSEAGMLEQLSPKGKGGSPGRGTKAVIIQRGQGARRAVVPWSTGLEVSRLDKPQLANS